MQSYWASVTSRRLSRRRAMTLAGGVAASAAFIAACGGDDSGDGGPGGESSQLAKPEDTSRQAKQGGIYKTYINTDAGGWDVHIRGAWFGTLGALMWSRLTIVEPGKGEKSSGNVAGDLAESWETSGDGLTLTFKLRNNAHWHNIAPVNGRAVDAEDVVATWDRWKRISNTRATIATEFNPDAPVQSVTAPNNNTVVMKLAFPAVSVPSLFSASVGQAFHIFPKEADTSYDPRTIAIGSGPFALKEHLPSSRIVLSRNEGYHHNGRPYFETVEYPILSEYATALASFKSGQVYQYAVTAEDILTTKNDVPDLTMYAAELTVPTANLYFGYRPTEQGMFRDKRLRQAYSMALDRDLFAETWFNVSKFTSQGLPVDTAWSTAVPADEYKGWWLDPRSSDFGANAKYFKRDIAEAKKLLSAAGFPNGVDYKSTRATGNYGPTYDQQIEITEGMAAEAGFRPTTNGVNYQTDLIPNYQNVQGAFEGTAWMLRPSSSSDPIDKLAEFFFSRSGSNFLGFDPEGKGDQSGDPTIDKLIRDASIEPDNKKRMSMLHEIQRHEAGQVYIIRAISGATSFELAWPVLKNFRYFNGARRSEEIEYFWLDPTRRPLA